MQPKSATMSSMVDLVSPVIILLVVLAVILRQTSAGVAVLALLAGVMLDQLLGEWILGLIPAQSGDMQIYVTVVVHLLLTFAPMVVAITLVKATRKSITVSLLTSLLLGFLVVYFGVKIVEPIPYVTEEVRNAGLISFLDPYQNLILSSAAVLAIVAIVIDHRKALKKKDK